MKTTLMERRLADTALSSRYEAGEKIEIGSLAEGSLVINEWNDDLGDVVERHHQIVIILRKTQKEVVCVTFDADGDPAMYDLRFKHDELVVLLIVVAKE